MEYYKFQVGDRVRLKGSQRHLNWTDGWDTGTVVNTSPLISLSAHRPIEVTWDRLSDRFSSYKEDEIVLEENAIDKLQAIL